MGRVALFSLAARWGSAASRAVYGIPVDDPRPPSVVGLRPPSGAGPRAAFRAYGSLPRTRCSRSRRRRPRSVTHSSQSLTHDSRSVSHESRLPAHGPGPVPHGRPCLIRGLHPLSRPCGACGWGRRSLACASPCALLHPCLLLCQRPVGRCVWRSCGTTSGTDCDASAQIYWILVDNRPVVDNSVTRRGDARHRPGSRQRPQPGSRPPTRRRSSATRKIQIALVQLFDVHVLEREHSHLLDEPSWPVHVPDPGVGH